MWTRKPIWKDIFVLMSGLRISEGSLPTYAMSRFFSTELVYVPRTHRAMEKAECLEAADMWMNKLVDHLQHGCLTADEKNEKVTCAGTGLVF
jgi:hypothetical protein